MSATYLFKCNGILLQSVCGGSKVGQREGLLFFEDEVGGGGAGGELDPVGDASGDVDDVSCMEDDFSSAVDAGAEGFAGAVCGGVGVLPLRMHSDSLGTGEL